MLLILAFSQAILFFKTISESAIFMIEINFKFLECPIFTIISEQDFVLLLSFSLFFIVERLICN